jgi:hypothetical protein
MLRTTLLIGALAALAVSQAARAQAVLTARLDRPRYVSGEEMHLAIAIENVSESRLPVLRAASLDDAFLGVVLTDRRTGVIVPAQAHRDAVRGEGDVVTLRPGERLEQAFDLHLRHPAGLAPGAYALHVEYRCGAEQYPMRSELVRDVLVAAAPIAFDVRARSASQDVEHAAYLAVLAGAEPEQRARRAADALEAQPAGLYARRLRTELAAAAWQLGDLGQARDLYRALAGDDRASPATRSRSQSNLAHVLHEQGDLADAIATMDAVNTPQARIDALVWRRERADGGR